MITLGFDNWDRGLAGHGGKGHTYVHDYHLYPQRSDRHYGRAQYNDRNAFLHINHAWNTFDDGHYPDEGQVDRRTGHVNNVATPYEYEVRKDSRRSDKYESNQLVGDFGKPRSGHVLYQGQDKVNIETGKYEQGK